MLRQELEREGVHLSVRTAACAESSKPSFAAAIEVRLCEDGTSGIARAEKEHVEGLRHIRPLLWRDGGAPREWTAWGRSTLLRNSSFL